MKRWIGIGLAVLGLIGTVWGAWCSGDRVNDDEHQDRIDAQVALHRAETDLALPGVRAEIQQAHRGRIEELNHVCIDPADLAGAVNESLAR